MGFISREQFLKQQQERQERSTASQNSGPRVGYFGLKNDGDEAIVRFAYEDQDALFKDILTTHQTTVDGKFRRVNCLRDFNDPIDNCPMCAAGMPVQQRFYIKLLEYERDENGKITSSPKVWERPTSYVNILLNLFEEYGDISECVFKVKRSGEKGSLQTTYSIMFANPSIYNSTLYPKDLSVFNDYNVIGSALLSKTKEEMLEMVPASTESTDNVKGTPTYKYQQTSQQTSPVINSQPRKVTY